MLTYIGTCRPQLPPHDEFLWCELKCPDGPVQMGYGQMVLGSERLFTLIEPRPTWWWDPERGDPVRLARVTSGHKPQLRPLVGAEGVVCAQSRKHPDRVWVNFGGEPQEVSMRYLERAAAERTEEEGAGPIPAKP